MPSRSQDRSSSRRLGPAALLVMAACGPGGGGGVDADTAALNRAAEGAMGRVTDRSALEVAHGFFVLGDNAADFTAWFDDSGDPVLIREHNGMGDWGNGTARYYLEGGGLAYYAAQHVRIDLQDPTAPRRRLHEVRIAFRPPAPLAGRVSGDEAQPGTTLSGLANLPEYSGRVLGEKTVDGVSVSLEDGEVAGVRVRAAVMADSARSARSARVEPIG
jgi:hypothetical protein